MTPKDHKRIEDALKVLEDEGRKSFNDPDGANRWDCIGLALAAVSDNTTGVLRLAYAFLEDWNAHDLCTVIHWAYPRIFEGEYHVTDLERLRRVMDKSDVPVIMNWGVEKPVKKRYNVKIVLEEVTDEGE